MDAVLVIGRILFAALFISSGIAHFAKFEAMTGYAKYKNLLAAKFGVMASGLFFILGGIYIALGIWVDLGALLIAITLFFTAGIFHKFWNESDATAKMNENSHFMKDLSLAGAALILFVLIYQGYVAGGDFGPHVGNLSFFNK